MRMTAIMIYVIQYNLQPLSIYILIRLPVKKHVLNFSNDFQLIVLFKSLFNTTRIDYFLSASKIHIDYSECIILFFYNINNEYQRQSIVYFCFLFVVLGSCSKKISNHKVIKNVCFTNLDLSYATLSDEYHYKRFS